MGKRQRQKVCEAVTRKAGVRELQQGVGVGIGVGARSGSWDGWVAFTESA
jgi:hypothetical protein